MDTSSNEQSRLAKSVRPAPDIQPEHEKAPTLMLKRGERPPSGWVSYERPRRAEPGWQETFDLVAQHMLTQVVPAVRCNGRRSYRTPDGLKCAVGVLIPDGAYGGDMEGLSTLDPFVAAALRRRGHSPGLCSALQDMHDTVPPARWPHQLRQIAAWYRLNSRVIDRLEQQFLIELSVSGSVAGPEHANC
jgi:hypothetical protein